MKARSFICAGTIAVLACGFMSCGPKEFVKCEEGDVLCRPIYEKACTEEKVGAACFEFGYMQLEGKGGNEDQVGARASFKKACELEASKGCAWAGMMAAKGVGGAEDVALARELLTKACDAKDPMGCHGLGEMWHYGKGGKDRDKAEEYYKLARQYGEAECNKNDAWGCLILGTLWRSGEGGDRDRQKALVYIDKSCTLGSEVGCTIASTLKELEELLAALEAQHEGEEWAQLQAEMEQMLQNMESGVGSTNVQQQADKIKKKKKEVAAKPPAPVAETAEAAEGDTAAPAKPAVGGRVKPKSPAAPAAAEEAPKSPEAPAAGLKAKGGRKSQ